MPIPNLYGPMAMSCYRTTDGTIRLIVGHVELALLPDQAEQVAELLQLALKQSPEQARSKPTGALASM